MATTPTYPGVYIQELPSAVHPITGVATSIGAFVGYTARGIDNRAEQIFSFADYERLFGGLASDSELSYAVQQFFTNGGTQAYVVRVPRSGAKGAQVVFNFLTFTALSSGTWADGQLLLDVDYNGVNQATDPTAFNLTVTSLVDGTVESFANLSLNNSFNNYITNVVNDPDNGSKLVSVQVGSPAPGAAPALTGLVGKALVIAAVNNSLAGSPLVTGTVKLVAGSATVAGSGGREYQYREHLEHRRQQRLRRAALCYLARDSAAAASHFDQNLLQRDATSTDRPWFGRATSEGP